MSLVSNVQSLAARVGAEFKTVRAEVAAADALKANAADVAAALALKPDAANVYTSAAADAAISTAINNLIGAAPGTLDTLAEIASAIQSDQTAASALTQEVALKAYAADVYAKSEVYTKSQIDAAVAPKANAADVYTKLESDAIEAALRSDIGAGFSSANFVSAFEAALIASA